MKKIYIIIGSIIAIVITLAFMKPLAIKIEELSQDEILSPVYNVDYTSSFKDSESETAWLFFTNGNRIFTWGGNTNGALGNNLSTGYTYSPTDISQYYTLNEEENIVSSTVSINNGYFLTSENRIFTWGSDLKGQLGNGDLITENILIPTDISQYYTLNEGEDIIDIEISDYFMLFLTSENRIFTWGMDTKGQLGNGDLITEDITVPTDISQYYTLNEGENIISLTRGSTYVGFLTTENRIFTWGTDNVGQLGNGELITGDITVPTDISQYYTLNEGEDIIEIYFGDLVSSFLTNENRIFTWGNNTSGKTGNNLSTGYTYSPTDISQYYTLNEEENIIEINWGGNGGYFLTTENRIFTWGSDSDGQLGNGDLITEDILVPTDISQYFTLNEGEDIVTSSKASSSGGFLTTDNRIFTWGNDTYTLLGNGESITVDITVPTDISQYYTLNEGEGFGYSTFSHYETVIDIIDTPFTKLLNIIPFVLISAIVLTATVLIKKEGQE